MLVNPRKRVLVTSSLLSPSASVSTPRLAPALVKRHKAAYDPSELPPATEKECARLVTLDPRYGKRALIVQLDKPFFIGRSASSDYRIQESSVSNKHARIYALVADTGEVLVCLEDLSANGTLYNDRKVSKATVILCEGDRIEIGGQVFRFYQTTSTSPAVVTGSERDSPAIAKTPPQIGNYIILPHTIGSGAFATVWLALNIKTLKQVACKRMSRKVVGEKSLHNVRREIDILKRATHPNINKIEDVEVSDDSVHIFLELVSGGDLFSFLVKRGRLDAPQAKWILYQMLHALIYLHEEVNVAHRDIKLENVLLCGSGSFPKIQLADFGQATVADRDFQSLKGTLSYMAPEQLIGWTRREGYDGKIADMWSTGIVLSFLLTGTHPFEPLSSQSSSLAYSNSIFGDTGSGEFEQNSIEQRLCLSVVQGEVGLPRMQFGSHDFDVRSLLSCLLNPDPATRSSSRRAIGSSWFKASARELTELYERVVGIHVVV